MKDILEIILNILYPKKCPICHKIPENTENMICKSCWLRLSFTGKHYCMKCGKPVLPEEEYCEECGRRRRNFTQGRSLLVYNETMKASMIRFKYGGRREYGDFYARLICVFGKKQILEWNPDLILPVPLHRRKKSARGFNQAEYLAKKIGKKLGIPVASHVLKKVKNTRSQKKLDAEKRRKNLRNAFAANEDFTGLKILIIDDVYTTGSTMDEIALVLKEKGAEKVYFFTICTGYN